MTSSKVLGRVFGWREKVELRDQSFWVLAGRWLAGGVSVRSVAVGGTVCLSVRLLYLHSAPWCRQVQVQVQVQGSLEEGLEGKRAAGRRAEGGPPGATRVGQNTGNGPTFAGLGKLLLGRVGTLDCLEGTGLKWTGLRN